MKPEKRLQIRNSTAEFLIFTRQAGEDGIEVRVAEETVWLTQKLMAASFEVTIPTISEHLANLYAQREISEPATIRNFRTVQKEGVRNPVGVDGILPRSPRVASRTLQPWADGCYPVGVNRSTPFPIPTGLHLSAQGCAPRATLGNVTPKVPATPTGLHHRFTDRPRQPRWS